MSRTVHGTSCWECSDFNIKNTMGEECEGNKHIFCDKSLTEHDAKVRATAIDEFISEIDLDKPMHFTKEQAAWIKKYVILKRQDAIEEQKELMYALADHVLKSQFGYCLTCENHMKNVTIDGVRNGCDGACSHSKEWTVEEFIDLFEKKLKLEKRLKEG